MASGANALGDLFYGVTVSLGVASTTVGSIAFESESETLETVSYSSSSPPGGAVRAKISSSR